MTDQHNESAVKFHAALTAANLEYAGMSWGGFNLFGDRESVQKACRMRHDAETLPIIRDQLVDTLRLSHDWMKKHDKLLAFIQASPRCSQGTNRSEY